MYQVTITNSFPSESDCDMFNLVVRKQWTGFRGQRSVFSGPERIGM